MQRHMVYLNGKIEKFVDVKIIKSLILICITIFLILTIINFIKKRSNKLLTAISVLIFLVIVMFLLFSNTQTNRAYYLISVCLTSLGLSQFIVYNLTQKYK